MPYYQKLGEMPRKHHIWFHRNGAGPSYKNEGIAYEHVITTEGFNEAYSIMYHLRPPTRVRGVKLLKCEELKKVTDSPLRHHHLKTAEIPRKGDLYTGRIPILFNQDMTAWRCRPERRTANTSTTRTAARMRSFSFSKAAVRWNRFSASNGIVPKITS